IAVLPANGDPFLRAINLDELRFVNAVSRVDLHLICDVVLPPSSVTKAPGRRQNNYCSQHYKYSAYHSNHGRGFSASTSGEGPGASCNRAFTKPASSSHERISANVYAFPFFVWSSMLMANVSGTSGPLRSSSTRNSPIAIVPPGASASNVFFSSVLFSVGPSMCRIFPSVAIEWSFP